MHWSEHDGGFLPSEPRCLKKNYKLIARSIGEGSVHTQ